MLLPDTIDEIGRTNDVLISDDVTFSTMLLSLKTLQGLNKFGFYKPSPIQLHGIPLGKCGFDLLLEAKSGTGKTAVFAVIALEKLMPEQGLQAVILAPTREIASQICHVIKQIGSEYEALQVEVVMGGLPVEEDIAKFKNKQKVNIVVGSPGRLRHLIQDGHIDISSVRLLVLDEADKLMEKSFLADINYIFSKLPSQKQVIMSSATYPDNAKSFLNQYIKNAQHICPDTTNVLIGIEQRVTYVSYNSNVIKQTKLRYEELKKILSSKPFKQCLIFCNYQARVAELHKLLTRDKWPAEQLYGQQEQSERLDALKTLQEYKCRILIATDLAARGIDASNVDLVVNFEPAYDWQTYLHRIGRAGRFGSYGIAITIISEGKEDIKFKKTLSVMKDSLKMKYLWSDEILQFGSSLSEDNVDNHNHGTIISENVVVSEEFSKQLWDKLNAPSDIEKAMNNINEPLLLETFKDLLESYENSTITNSQDIVYPTLGLEDINIMSVVKLHGKPCGKSANDLVQDEPQRESKKKEEELGSMAKKESSRHVEEIFRKKGTKTVKIDSKINKMLPEISRFSQNNEKPQCDNLNSDTLNDYVSDTTVNDEMIALGLPTQFCCSSREKKGFNNGTISNKEKPQCDNLNSDSLNDYVSDTSVNDEMIALGLPTRFCSSREKKRFNKGIISNNFNKVTDYVQNELNHINRNTVDKCISAPIENYNTFRGNENEDINHYAIQNEEHCSVNYNLNDEMITLDHSTEISSSWKKKLSKIETTNKSANKDPECIQDKFVNIHEYDLVEPPHLKNKNTLRQSHMQNIINFEQKNRRHCNGDYNKLCNYGSESLRYDDWYYFLKLKTKQIEMAYYIEEMTKCKT